MEKVLCTMCDSVYYEDELALIQTTGDEDETITAIEYANGGIDRREPTSENSEYFKGCPICETDGYLMDIKG